MSVIVGIDPGANGGIAAFYPEQNKTIVMVMPDVWTDLIPMLETLADGNTRVYVEKMSGFMGVALPAARIGKLMENYGFIVGACAALKLPVKLVPPKEWQLHIGAGVKGKTPRTQWKNKIKSIMALRHPGVNVTLSTADALGILEFAKSDVIHGTSTIPKARA